MYLVLWLVGVGLWVPGIALINIGGAWGLQVVSALSVLLFGMIVCVITRRALRCKTIIVNRDWLFVYTVFAVASLLSTLLSPIGVERSLQSFSAEMVGVVFSMSLAWAFISISRSFEYFVRGFRFAGAIFSLYAIYQVVAFRLQLPFGYLPMNNLSFAIVDEGSAIFLGRALGLTPEPSILASLLLMLFGIALIDLLVQGGIRTYMMSAIVLAGFLATGSQSVIILPMYVVMILASWRVLGSSYRRINICDVVGLGTMAMAASVFIATNPTVAISISRLFDTANATQSSLLWRLNDLSTSFEIFRQNPVVGSGLGALSVQAALTRQFLGLDGESGASNGIFRMIAEQGLAGIAATLITCFWLFPRRIHRASSSPQLTQMLQHVALLFGALFSLSLFVGYRNVFNLWLLIPLLLSFKHQYCLVRYQPGVETAPQPALFAGRSMPA
jgi:hypothetical protein